MREERAARVESARAAAARRPCGTSAAGPRTGRSAVSPKRGGRAPIAGAHQRLVRDQAALRLGGRAGRVHHDRDVADAHRLAQPRRSSAASTPAPAAAKAARSRYPSGEDEPSRITSDEERRARCGRLVQERHEVDVVGDRVRGDDGGHVAVLEHVGELVGLVAGVDEQRLHADERAAEEHVAGSRACSASGSRPSLRAGCRARAAIAPCRARRPAGRRRSRGSRGRRSRPSRGRAPPGGRSDRRASGARPSRGAARRDREVRWAPPSRSLRSRSCPRRARAAAR